MPKFTKEFSDAIGFKKLSDFNGFIKEYPVVAAGIEKVYTEDFKHSCFESFKLIADVGVDPAQYVPKAPTGNLYAQMKAAIPIKKQVEKKESPIYIANDSDTDESESLLTESILTVNPPKPAQVFKPATLKKSEESESTLANSPKRRLGPVAAFRQCNKCAHLEEDLKLTAIELKKRNETINSLKQKLQNIQHENEIISVEKAAFVTKFNNADAKLKNVERENTVLKTQNANMKARIEKDAKELTELRAQLKHVQTESASFVDRLLKRPRTQ